MNAQAKKCLGFDNPGVVLKPLAREDAVYDIEIRSAAFVA
jgi:hypothetical protein